MSRDPRFGAACARTQASAVGWDRDAAPVARSTSDPRGREPDPSAGPATAPEECDDAVAHERSAGSPEVAEPAWLSAPAAPTPRPGPDRGVARADVRESRPRRPSWFGRHRGALLAAAAFAALVAAVTTAGLLLNSRTVPDTGHGAAVDVPDTRWCAGLGVGEPASVDADDPGAAAIAGFEWGYYVLRDGARARDHVAPNARVGSAERLDREGIDTLPVGTTHCVLTKKVADGLYVVDVWERRPDGSTEHYPQTIRTAATPDGALITSITVRE